MMIDDTLGRRQCQIHQREDRRVVRKSHFQFTRQEPHFILGLCRLWGTADAKPKCTWNLQEIYCAGRRGSFLGKMLCAYFNRSCHINLCFSATSTTWGFAGDARAQHPPDLYLKRPEKTKDLLTVSCYCVPWRSLFLIGSCYRCLCCRCVNGVLLHQR